MARILQEDIPAAHSQQFSLPCLCSAPVPWLCKHYFFFFANDYAQTRPCVCKHYSPHSQVNTALKDPFIRVHLKGGADGSTCLRLTTQPCPPTLGHTYCAMWSVTWQQQIQFMRQQSQRNAKHIWLCQVAPHRWHSSYGSRTNPRFCFLLFGHHERPGLCRMAAREH